MFVRTRLASALGQSSMFVKPSAHEHGEVMPVHLSRAQELCKKTQEAAAEDVEALKLLANFCLDSLHSKMYLHVNSKVFTRWPHARSMSSKFFLKT